MSRAPKRKCWDIPASFELIDIAALTGAERDLVTSMFGHHTEAAHLVIDDLNSFDITPARACDIMLSCALVMAGINARQIGLTRGEFSTVATRALDAATAMVDIGSDIEGEA